MLLPAPGRRLQRPPHDGEGLPGLRACGRSVEPQGRGGDLQRTRALEFVSECKGWDHMLGNYREGERESRETECDEKILSIIASRQLVLNIFHITMKQECAPTQLGLIRFASRGKQEDMSHECITCSCLRHIDSIQPHVGLTSNRTCICVLTATGTLAHSLRALACSASSSSGRTGSCLPARRGPLRRWLCSRVHRVTPGWRHFSGHVALIFGAI